MPKSASLHSKANSQPKRIRKSKIRTQDSSEGDSDSSSTNSVSDSELGTDDTHSRTENQAAASSKKAQLALRKKNSTFVATTTIHDQHALATPPRATSESFPSFYLKKMTNAFPDDLDRIRNAGDFSDATLPLLVLALQQGEQCFRADEKQAIETVLAEQQQ